MTRPPPGSSLAWLLHPQCRLLGPPVLLYPWFEDVAIPVEGPLSEDEGDGSQREGGRRRKGEKGCGGRRLSARAGRRGGGATPMVSSEGGRRGMEASVGAGVGSGAATPRGGLEAEHARGLGKSLFHARTIDPANKRIARAHQSLDNKNDREVKIDFNFCEDPTAQARQKGRSDGRRSSNRGSLVEVSWLASLLF